MPIWIWPGTVCVYVRVAASSSSSFILVSYLRHTCHFVIGNNVAAEVIRQEDTQKVSRQERGEGCEHVHRTKARGSHKGNRAAHTHAHTHTHTHTDRRLQSARPAHLCCCRTAGVPGSPAAAWGFGVGGPACTPAMRRRRGGQAAVTYRTMAPNSMARNLCHVKCCREATRRV